MRSRGVQWSFRHTTVYMGLTIFIKALIMESPSLQQFEIFLEVAKLRSFTATAAKMGVTKASISHSIKKLEHSLDVPLFTRTTRSIALTDEGSLLFEQCMRLQSELDAARSLVGTFKKEPNGMLRILSNKYYAETHLLPVLENYQKKYSNVEVELLIEERMPDMIKENVDIVFATHLQASDDIVVREIDHTRYMLVASPDYLKEHGVPKSVEDLKNHLYMMHLARAKDNILADLKKPVTPNLNIPLKINSTDLIRTCALLGKGIAQLHDYIVKDDVAAGRLVELLPECFNKSIPLYIYYHKYRFVQPKIRCFVDEFFDFMRRHD